MNTMLLSLTISILIGLGFVGGLFALNLLSGTFEFLFGKPKFELLKSSKGVNGFAFLLRWDSTKEPGRFNQVRVRLYNPFGRTTQTDVFKEFEAKGESFAIDLDMGPGFQDLLNAQSTDRALVVVEVGAVQDRLFHQEEMKAHKFFDLRKEAKLTVDDFYKKPGGSGETKVYYHTVEKNMIADPMPKDGKALRLATNPEFAHEFTATGAAGEGGSAAAAVANFIVSKVWIEPGCIVCNACEDIFPEVFKVNADTCVIKPDYPKDNGLRVKEASDACPVEVIKYTVA